MFGDDDEEELPPEIDYRDLRRRSFEAAALWIGGVALCLGFGLMEWQIAVVIASSGALSALALAGYWHVKLRRLGEPR